MIRYAFTIFLGAFLLFLVQPMIGKFILPWFGGGPGIWTTCMLFFQVLLLVGYAYAHLIVTHLSPRAQALVHLALLALALATLPVIPDQAWKPTTADNPTLRILLLLGVSLGLPYLVLSTTGPLMQAWFTRTHPGVPPYRLYALSNAGSLLALLGYPFLMEPAMTRQVQAIIWSVGFGGFAAVCAWCAIAAARKGAAAAEPALTLPTQPVSSVQEGEPRRHAKKSLEPDSRQPRAKPKASPAAPNTNDQSGQLALWIALPACASILLLSATSLMSEEIAPAPFLWVLPLAVYLLSFIVTFDRPGWYYRPVFVSLLVCAPWLYFAGIASMEVLETGIVNQVLLYMTVLFAGCMVCHGELYRVRPPANRLTGFYLAIAFGGALGGAFVSILAPLIFVSYLEWHIGMFGAIALMFVCLFRDSRSPFFRAANRHAWLGIIMFVLLAGFLISRTIAKRTEHRELPSRNFYGILSVDVFENKEKDGLFMRLRHGRISHGSQITQAFYRRMPLSYYSEGSAVGLVMRLFRADQPRRVGTVGLGVGTLAAFGRKGDVFRFYEINPLVEDYARYPFTYLEDSAATIEVVLGDARLTLEREPTQNYDVLVLDAFSGDAIPVHLLTREAFVEYKRHLAPGGVILVNITNRYLDLRPVVQRVAAEFDWSVTTIETPENPEMLTNEAHWMIVTANKQVLEHPEIVAAGQKSERPPDVSLWTDEYCSILQALR